MGAADHTGLLAMRCSALALAWNAVTGQAYWKPAWRDAAPRETYDVVIVGGGAHGLATTYYLAKEHGIANVAVLEKSWIGSGNAGRNTTIIRSNYLLPGNIPFYEWSMKLWEGLEQDLNYNTMVSQRGVLNLDHSDRQRDAFARRGNAMRLHGVWGYARAADRRGVDIVQNCEVTGIRISNGRVVGVDTARGPIRADKVALAVAGSSSRLAAMASLRLPIESHVLQAFVSEGVKPLIHQVITFGAGHFYISQSDKGGLVFGGDLDGYNSYAQRATSSSFPAVLLLPSAIGCLLPQPNLASWPCTEATS
jgi:methylglutamate dehydrogenase subunit A